MNNLSSEFERLIRRGDFDSIDRLLKTALRRHGAKLECRVTVATYFARLGRNDLALRTLPKPEKHPPDASNVGLHDLASATRIRTLNRLGASQWAMDAIRAAPQRLLRSYSSIFADVLISNEQFSLARGLLVPQLKDRLKLIHQGDVYRDGAHICYLARCLFNLGDLERATDLIEEVQRSKQAPFLKGVGLCYLAEAHCFRKDRASAERALSRAETYFPATARSFNAGFVHTLKGAFKALCHDIEGANQELELAWSILHRPASKPEVWLGILYWKGYCELKSVPGFPTAWARMIAYPGPASSHYLQRIGAECRLPSELYFNGSGVASRADSACLDAPANVFRPSSATCGARLGISKAEHLVALLLRAGPLGLPRFRAYEQLWREERSDFKTLEKRLEQIIIVARQQGHLIRIQDSSLFLEKAAKSMSTRWARDPEPQGLRYLDRQKGFTRADVERVLGIRRRKAAYLCREWLDNGHVTVSRFSGKSLRYQ